MGRIRDRNEGGQLIRMPGVVGKETTAGESSNWELPQELLDGGQGKTVMFVEAGGAVLEDKDGGQQEEGGDGEAEGQGGTGLGISKVEVETWAVPPGLPPSNMQWQGLEPPVITATGAAVTGATKGTLRRQAARERKARLERQRVSTQWTQHLGEFVPSILESSERIGYRGGMCPRGLALEHPAASLLQEWATYGCPAMTGKEWTRAEMTAAIARGPHESALSPEAIAHFKDEVKEKVACGQARVVNWEDIKHNPPPQLKISPIAAIPHKSKAFQSILDLSFRLRLDGGG